MLKSSSRRGFLGASAAATVASLANPGQAAAQGAGVKAADLPDLTIKEVRVYNIGTGRGATQLAGIVTNSGIEGNYSLAARYWHPNWSNAGWLDYAKRTLLGKSVLDLPALTSQCTQSQRSASFAVFSGKRCRSSARIVFRCKANENGPFAVPYRPPTPRASMSSNMPR